jgi:hypothetical protein
LTFSRQSIDYYDLTFWLSWQDFLESEVYMNSRMRLVFSIGLLGLFCLMLPGSLRADAAGQQILGYLYSGGTFITIGVPGATFTSVSGINDAGQIVGSYETGEGEPKGFVDNGGVFTTISAPGATILSANGINDAGQIVGTYGLELKVDGKTIGSTTRGFVDNGGVFTTISVSGATPFTDTFATGINDAGQIVGDYIPFVPVVPAVPEPGTLTLELAGIVIIAAAATLRLCAAKHSA